MSEHYPGMGCHCWAHSENDCCCEGVDWRSTREVELETLVEKLTKERDTLVDAIDNEMVVTHLGVFNAGDDPKVALNKICCYAQDLGKFFAEDACKGQLAALAEQNEKMRAALRNVVDDAEECTDFDGWTAMLLSLDAYHIASTCLEEINDQTDLATPVLNRIRAEGMRMAAEICEHISDEYREREGRRYPELKTDAETGASDCESSIRARAAELEKT